MYSQDSYDAGVYWACRRESAEECARRAESFFRLLSSCDPIYADWFEQANSLKKALQLRFEPNYETFLRFFKKKAYQNGPGEISFSAWTGHEEDGRGGAVSLTCGACSKFYSNVCFLYLPWAGPEEERVLTVPVLTQVMRALILAWEPDDGGVFSDAYQRLRNEPVGPPRTGWLMYFSRRRGEVPALPEPVRVEPVEDKGTLVILTPERFTVDDPAHVALASEVRAVLDRAGLLKEYEPAPAH
ncbi:immunity 52 family protein [Archangium violaceum]|uniref:immunity 52 family protein n=1 Tax=Archangium violaceum TaxID=83451 RepID=UPI00194FCA48|nr:immunity 52 family protein [Archangium violaceum]QRN93423.1 immunity 52 family protein [Archangium violaceum]